MDAWLETLLALLALPKFGLSTVFVVSFISATLLPLGSEPAVFGLVKLNPELFWSAIAVATVGNTLGGAVSWWMGLASHQVVDRYHHSDHHLRALAWLEKLGPKACLLAWLPWWATRCAPWRAGSSCRSGLVWPTWRSAKHCVIC
jgi:membrane protein YqaA with SNARE-associated domain